MRICSRSTWSPEVIFLAVIFVLIQGGCYKTTEEDATLSVQELSRTLQFGKIVTRFKSVKWDEHKSYSDVVVFVEAFAEEGQSIPPDFVKSPLVPSHIRNFAVGYLRLLNGKHKQALSIFSQIEREDWKTIGILEYAIQTGSDSLFSAALEQLEREEAMKHLTDPSIVPYYKAIASLTLNEPNTLMRVLEENRKLFSEDFYLEFLVRALIGQNRLAEAQAIVDDFQEAYPNSQNFIVLNSEIIELRHGAVGSVDYLKKMSEKWPQMWIVKQRYAHGLLTVGKVDEGIDVLWNTALERKFDVIALLDLVDVLVDYGRLNEAESLVRDIDTNQLLTPYINIVRAKIQARLGRQEKAQEEIKIARQLAPANLDVLWALYDVASIADNGPLMRKSLTDLVALDPYNIQAHIELANIYHTAEQWNFLGTTIKAIRSSGRYIDKDVERRLQAYETTIRSKEVNSTSKRANGVTH